MEVDLSSIVVAPSQPAVDTRPVGKMEAPPVQPAVETPQPPPTPAPAEPEPELIDVDKVKLVTHVRLCIDTFPVKLAALKKLKLDKMTAWSANNAQAKTRFQAADDGLPDA